MGTISRKLGDDELPLSSEAAEAADTDLIGDHEDRGRTGNYILISVISEGAVYKWRQTHFLGRRCQKLRKKGSILQKRGDLGNESNCWK